MTNMSLTDEILADLANTESDIVALSNIVGGLDTFMTRTGGEDRSAFKMDRFKYAALLAKAHRLKQAIQDKHTESIRASEAHEGASPR